jgi:O-antigen ligase
LSRTNILAFIVFLLIFIFYNFRYSNIGRGRLISLFMILLLLACLSSVFLLDIVAARSFTFEDSSSDLRWTMVLKGIAVLAENPVFGIGFGNFELDDGFDEFGSITGRPGHDLVSVAFASTGLLGTILFILICYRTLRYFNSAVRHFIALDDRYLTNLIITMKSAYIALLLSCLGNPIIFQRIFWIYTALAVVLHFWSRKESMPSAARAARYIHAPYLRFDPRRMNENEGL